MENSISHRAKQISSSPAAQASTELMSSDGPRQDIIQLHDGEPNLAPPSAVISATREALAAGFVKYDHINGLGELRKALIEDLEGRYNLEVNADEILVSNGSSQAIYQLLMCLLDVNDRVLVPVPAWPTYLQSVRMAGGVPLYYRCSSHGLDFDEIDRLMTQKPKLIIVNSPHNPTGWVAGRSDIQQLVDRCVRHDALLVADAAYEDFTYNGLENVDIRAFSGPHRARVLTTRSFSKSYGMTGFRIGFLHAEREIVERCAALQTHLSDNVCTFAQFGALAAIRHGRPHVEEWAKTMEKRVSSAHLALSNLFPCAMADGGFYLFPNVSEFLSGRWKDANSLARSIQASTGVKLLPGGAFGSPNHVRLSMSGEELSRIEEGIGRIEEFLRTEA